MSEGRVYPLKRAVLESFAKSTDLPLITDGNAGDPIGIGPFTENWLKRKRQPAGKAYGLAGVRVITNSAVRRITIENGVATGAELLGGKIIKAKKEVIVRCGALRAPQVLMLSGLGPKAELTKHGIEQVVSNEAVEHIGQNLSDHVAVPIFYKVKHTEQALAVGAAGWTDPSHAFDMPVDVVVTANAANEATKAALVEDGEEAVSDAHPYLNPIRGHLELVRTYAVSEAPLTGLNLPLDGTVISSGILTLLPTSRGSVTLTNTNPTTHPLIGPNYFSTAADKAVTRHGLRLTLQAFGTSPLTEQIEETIPPPGHKPLTSQSSDAELDEYAVRTAATWYHPAGTCAMGKVLDAEGRLIGVNGLRVVDASISPGPLAAHYQAPVYAVAEKMAEIIVAGAA